MMFCKNCHTETTHTKGTFRCGNIEGELFVLKTSTDETLKKLSGGFNHFIEANQEPAINSQATVDYIKSDNAKSNIAELFSKSIRAFKCMECGHLIKFSKLP